MVVSPEAAREKCLHTVADDRDFGRPGNDDRDRRHNDDDKEEDDHGQRPQAAPSPRRAPMAQGPRGPRGGIMRQASGAHPAGLTSVVIQHSQNPSPVPFRQGRAPNTELRLRAPARQAIPRSARIAGTLPIYSLDRYRREATKLRRKEGDMRKDSWESAAFEAGSLAPDFALPTDGGGQVRLADLRGRKVVLYFYPADDTEGCTLEAVNFTALLRDFEAAGTT